MKRRLVFALVGVAFLIGALAGHQFAVAPAPSAEAPVARLVLVTNVVTVTQTNVVNAARFPSDSTAIERLELDNSLLQARLAEAERMLRESRSRAQVVADAPRQEPARQEPARERPGMQERLERFRAEEPERFAEFEAQRKEFRERVKTAVDDRVTFLRQLDVGAMTPEEREANGALVARIEQLWAAFEGINEGRMPDRETRNALRESMTEVRELYDVQRNFVLRQVGAQLGFGRDEAVEFSEYMNEIYELTTPHFPRGMRFPRMPGRREERN